MSNAALPLLALSNWGLAIAILFLMVIFGFVTWVILQGTRAHMHWRERVEQGDVDTIRMLAADEIDRWKGTRRPKQVEPGVWHGVQSAELADVTPDSIHVSAVAEGQYALIDGERREVSNSFREALKLTARLAELLLYDVPNVRLPGVRIDIFSTYRDDTGATQKCIMSTFCDRAIASTLDWDDDDPEDIVRAFGGRFALDDRGRALPIDVTAPAASVPAAFYEDL